MSRSSEEFAREAARIRTLTPRERAVCRLVGEGLTNRQVSEKLGISSVTVRHHLSSAYSKLGVANRFELIIFCYRHGHGKGRADSDGASGGS